jgi:MFS family permease
MMDRNNESSRSTVLQFIAVAAAACLLYGISAGIRANYGIMLQALVDSSGVDYEGVSFVIAVGQLIVGVVQPFFGALAIKKSNSFVLVTGAAMMMAGMGLLPLSHSFFMLMLTLGILVSAGAGALAFGIVMGAITPAIGEKKAVAVSGFVSASSGLGGIVLSPLMQQLIVHAGLKGMLWILCIPMTALIMISLWLGGKEKLPAAASAETPSFIETFRATIGSKSYLCIALAFFTCGFHMSIIETHLYSQYVSYGFDDTLVAFAFSFYGVAAMLGCILTGFLDTKFKNKWVLGCTYASRILIGAVLLLLPKSVLLVYITAFLLGLTGNATVPPTSGLLTKLFGAKNLGALFGIAFLFHQVGAFFSSWLGGIIVAKTGGYDLYWIVSMIFTAGAAALAFCVDEK